MIGYSKIIVVMVCLFFGYGSAQMSIKAMGSDGWGYSDKYEQNFTKFNVQTYYGDVKSIDTVTPIPDMAYGIQLSVTIDSKDIPVHLGPAWFILRQDNVNFSKGDKVEIKGAKVFIDGKQVIMASQVKQTKRNDRKLLLRDQDGIPLWCSYRKD